MPRRSCAEPRWGPKRLDVVQSADPATAGIRRARASPCFSGYLLKCLLLCHLNLSSGRSGRELGQPNLRTLPPPGSARPSGRAQTPPQASHGPLWSALARCGTTFRERISKMVASGASSQAPEGLPLQRELDFQFQHGSHFGPHLGSIFEPKRGPCAL